MKDTLARRAYDGLRSLFFVLPRVDGASRGLTVGRVR
jgi:hypothetical protein